MERFGGDSGLGRGGRKYELQCHPLGGEIKEYLGSQSTLPFV